MGKTYELQTNIGHCKYVITYYSGERYNRDGSMACDISIYQNRRKANQFIRELQRNGYVGPGCF